MTTISSCPHEQDVFELARRGQWPSCADPWLRDHVASCAVCGDLAPIAAALAGWRDAGSDAVQVPDASRVWREAERRARAAAARRAARPVLVVELAALAAAGLLVMAWGPGLGALAASLADVTSLTGWAADLKASLSGAAGQMFSPSGWSPALSAPLLRWSLVAVSVWVVLLPVALSLASLADRMPGHEAGHSKPAR